ncbi:MAG: heavy-metal-associated domain-containing protein [Bacteroidales bacterium]|nr:heavy-metal-associated domain-containing protein [Bacteroidales bacterium]
MTKNFKIEVDCANCANQVETAIKKIEGIENAVISFMTQKMKITFAEGADTDAIMEQVKKTARRIEPDFEIL